MLAWLATGAVEAADHGVDVLDNRYEPATITVAPGDKVIWTNKGLLNHTVTADNRSFTSGPMLPTERFGPTFTEPGRYPYRCDFHEDQGMQGVVIVRAATATSSTTTTTRVPRTTSTLEPGGSAVTAPGETTTTTVDETTTTVAETTTTTRDLDLAAGGDLGDGGDDTSTGLAAALASLLLLGVSGSMLLLLRKGQLV